MRRRQASALVARWPSKVPVLAATMLMASVVAASIVAASVVPGSIVGGSVLAPSAWVPRLARTAAPTDQGAQLGRLRDPTGPSHVVEYDGTLAFTRLRFSSLRGGFGGGAWLHDYPAADKNLSAILNHITRIRVRLDGTNVLELTDPRLFENPILYVWEPGYWTLRDVEVEPLRQYLLKGGFVIFDDFEGPAHWANMTAQMRRALPDHQFVRIDVSHPIFHAFFNISNLQVPHPSVNVVPAYYALFEQNDPARRMIALANHNNDIAEYWEWSVEGLYNPDPTNDAYRLGVNYYVYAMTH